MDEMNHLDLLDKKEKTMNHIYNIQQQKSYYLGEYRERVLVALKEDQLIEDELYPEVIEAMKDKRAKVLKLKRNVGLQYLKPYIKEAEKLNFRYELIDGISYRGDIALIVATEESIDNEEDDVVIRDVDQDFLDAGLGYEFSKNQGKHVCNECHLKIEDKLPNYIDKFQRLTFIDKLLGKQCPVCRDRKKYGGNK